MAEYKIEYIINLHGKEVAEGTIHDYIDSSIDLDDEQVKHLVLPIIGDELPKVESLDEFDCTFFWEPVD
ncbi:hypothetical protein GCM10011571_33540 [Marinithermofilum abyssi]|uniref:Uncharacterized protein n=1 Tax=Marinithermofilum abyssi TaxID=1571185 RepID=A0A8J2VKD1_9BACL|nr:hypothetical protein [Marinithermofilum abyssi]GGE28714.1 hypothetical protein GCM10011571_33540 [Marinithermofilum abyssi]